MDNSKFFIICIFIIKYIVCCGISNAKLLMQNFPYQYMSCHPLQGIDQACIDIDKSLLGLHTDRNIHRSFPRIRWYLKEKTEEISIYHSRKTFKLLQFIIKQLIVIPFNSIPFHFILFRSISFYSIPFNLTLFPSILFHSIPFHSIPFHCISFYSTPFHSIPFHTISFHYFNHFSRHGKHFNWPSHEWHITTDRIRIEPWTTLSDSKRTFYWTKACNDLTSFHIIDHSVSRILKDQLAKFSTKTYVVQRTCYLVLHSWSKEISALIGWNITG